MKEAFAFYLESIKAMKRLIRYKYVALYLISSMLIFSIAETTAQWKQLAVGSPGSGLWAVAVAGSNVFAGTAGGIFKSTNNGATWTNVSSIYTGCFTVKGSEIFAGTEHNGVIVSTDNGETWIQRDPEFKTTVNALTIKDSIIFAGGGGMFRSTDDGASWTTIENGLGYGQTTVSGLTVTDGKILASTFAGVVLSTDDGDDWSTLVGTDEANDVTNCVAAIDSTVLVGWVGGIIRSTDDGTSWIEGSSWINTSTTFCIVGDSSRIYAGTVSGVHLSTDDGVTWRPVNNGLPGDQVLSMAKGVGILFASTFNYGVFRSTDSGATWTSASSGIVLSEVNSIAGEGPDVYAVMNNGSMYSSTDYGITWNADTSLHVGTTSVSVIGQKVYAATNSGIFVSSDNGTTWDAINGGVMDTTYPTMVVQSGENLIAATQESGGVFFSSDNGLIWKNVGQNLPELASLEVSGSTVVAGTRGGVYVSKDDGETWANVNDTLININALAATDLDVFAGRYLWPVAIGSSQSTAPGGVFRSTDGGLTWSPFSSGLPFDPQTYAPAVYSIAVHGGYVFAGLDPGLYTSTITDNNWVNIGQNLPNGRVLSLFVNDSSVFVGTELSGIWLAPLSEVTGIKSPTTSALPKSFQLEQNYPNPFNPSTTISYQLSKASNATLSVYDILGRHVATLIDAKQNPGNYKVVFNASKISSGVYFYRLETNNYVAVRRMIVIK
jgi:photosystem II stability/assembly factor-like uncharacterized protein